MALVHGPIRWHQQFGRSPIDNTFDEQSLIERCRKQDAEAFGRFVDLYQHRVFGFIRRMVMDAEDAADLTQEVFIRAYQSFGRFDGRSSAKTWLFKIAHNLCVDAARKKRRSFLSSSLDASADGDEPTEVPDDRWEPERLTLEGELADRVEAAILAMSEKLRSVLLLHDRENMAYDEIAVMVGIPIGTVKSRLFLARSFLQNHLGDYLSSNDRLLGES